MKNTNKTTTCTQLIAKYLRLLEIWPVTAKILLCIEKLNLDLACLYLNEYTKSV